MTEPAPPAISPSEEGGPSWPWRLAVAALVVGSLVGPIAASGIWDPYELTTAELGRRIAVGLLGAKELATGGEQLVVPTIGELGRGQLPFTSIALGFRWLGLHEWAGRLPLALWGVVGVVAVGALVARLADRWSAYVTAVVLATFPLYFVQARTMLGDGVTAATLAVAVAGLGVAVFDARLPTTGRVAALGVGLLGLWAGYHCRGALLGVAVPLLGVGASWLLLRGRGGPPSRARAWLGAGALGAGAVAVAVGMIALGRGLADPETYQPAVGAVVRVGGKLPTFDVVAQQLGHALFPWSALLPLMLGRLLAPPFGLTDEVAARQLPLRLLALVVPSLGLLAQGLLAPAVGQIAFSATPLLAVAVALTLADFRRGAPGSPALVLGSFALAALLLFDFKEFPDKTLSAFAVEGATFPESFKQRSLRWLVVGSAVGFTAFGAAFLEREPVGGELPRFQRADYVGWWRWLRGVREGSLFFMLCSAELVLVAARLVGWAPAAWLAQRPGEGSVLPLLRQVATLQQGPLGWAWLMLPAACAAPWAAWLARDALRAVAARRPWRAELALAPVALFGVALSVAQYPALASQISPKEVFDAYRRHAAAGEPLAILGVGESAVRYYAGKDVQSFATTTEAFDWLRAAEGRRWLVLRAKELPQLNSSYRASRQPPSNLPILDARSSEILLASNELRPGERSDNFLDAWVLSAAPQPQHPLDGAFGTQLDCLGWAVTAPDGEPVTSVLPGKPYDFRIYYHVKAPISGNWETFIHIDGYSRRHNGDHKTLDDRYPLHLWRVGDYIQDVHRFVLEPNFGAGQYSVYFGLFIGNKRLPVTRGAQHEDRLEGGRLQVR